MGAEPSTPGTALVTGGAGFIGSHLTEALLDRGWRVRVLDDLSAGKRDNLPLEHGNLEFIEGDIRDLETCQRACRGVRWVFHQAALGSVPRSLTFPAASLAVNVGGTANVFTAARDGEVERVVFASSSSVYGDSQELPKREGREGLPLSPYALSKWMDEELADLYGRAYGMEIIGLRYFNVYGPRQDPQGAYAAVIPRFVAALLRGERPGIHGDGEQSRDFTFVADAVAANLHAAGAPKTACGRAYNVACGRRTTVNELAETLRSLLGVDLKPHHGPPRAGDVAHSLADLTAVGEGLGYVPSVTLRQGLVRSLEYYRELLSGSSDEGSMSAT